MEARYHPHANGIWSLALSELNKRLFLKAYMKRVDEAAFRKAQAESRRWLEYARPEWLGSRHRMPAIDAESPEAHSALHRKWLREKPETTGDLIYWVAIHQRPVFETADRKGALLRGFPALSRSAARPDAALTYAFYCALEGRTR